MNKNIFIDDEPIDISAEANFIWSIANKLRGVYLPDKYGDVVLPMTVIRRFECVLEKTKNNVIDIFEKNKNAPYQQLERISGYKFFNTSKFNLNELCNDPDNISENFRNYVDGFSPNIIDILKELDIYAHIEKMNNGDCLYSVVKAFSELDLSVERFDSIKMGYIFENLIGRFYQNVDAGQFYTGRDIIKLMASILLSEGCDDLSEDHKVITVCDQACGTGGMLTTAFTFLKRFNSTADIRLFGQEFNGTSYAVGLAEMLIKGQDGRNYRHADTFKEDCFKDIKMRFVIENPPFGTPWAGEDAKEGQEEAVKKEYEKASKGENCRWGAGLPSGGDSQLLFLQSAIDKLDDNGRAAIIENGSPLFTGQTSSGESQIRRWLLENDLLESVIALPTDLFYNTGIQTFIWIISKNKMIHRKGKVQLIDASTIFTKLRKGVGKKRNEFSVADREKITRLYSDFKENEFVKIFDNNDFIYREYTILQPLQRNYTINDERINNLVNGGYLSFLYDESKVNKLENSEKELDEKKKKKLNFLKENKCLYDSIIDRLQKNKVEKIFKSKSDFEDLINNIFKDLDKKAISKIIDGLSAMDKTADIQKDKKGNVIFDKETKDIETICIKEDINDYMKKNVLPYIPDAVAFFEENLNSKNKIIKTGAEIPFTRYFYKYKEPLSSKELLKKFKDLENVVRDKIDDLF